MHKHMTMCNKVLYEIYIKWNVTLTYHKITLGYINESRDMKTDIDCSATDLKWICLKKKGIMCLCSSLNTGCHQIA